MQMKTEHANGLITSLWSLASRLLLYSPHSNISPQYHLSPIPSQLQTVPETQQQRLQQQTVLMTEVDEASKEQTSPGMELLGQKRGSKAVVVPFAAPAGRRRKMETAAAQAADVTAAYSEDF